MDDLTDQQINDGDYFSDTQLVYNEVNNRIECYYRLSEEKHSNSIEKGVWIFRRSSVDGVNWSGREIVVSPWQITPEITGLPCISPAIIRHNDTYLMWYVVNNDSNLSIKYSVSKDGKCWENGKDCCLSGVNIEPWHIDCKYIDGKYYMLIYDFTQRITLWNSIDGLNFKYENTVLLPSHKLGSFYKSTLYRSCIIQDDSGIKVYFSSGNEREVHIGLMIGNSFEKLEVFDTGKYGTFFNFFRDYIMKYFFIERWLIWRLIKRRKNVSFKI